MPPAAICSPPVGIQPRARAGRAPRIRAPACDNAAIGAPMNAPPVLVTGIFTLTFAAHEPITRPCAVMASLMPDSTPYMELMPSPVTPANSPIFLCSDRLKPSIPSEPSAWPEPM